MYFLLYQAAWEHVSIMITVEAIYWTLCKVSVWLFLQLTPGNILKVSEIFPVAISIGNSVCGLIVEKHLPQYELTCCIIKTLMSAILNYYWNILTRHYFLVNKYINWFYKYLSSIYSVVDTILVLYILVRPK